MADFLAEQLPPYEQWFRDWRARRDQMKLGARFEVVFETDPPRIRGLSFVFPRLATSTDLAEGAVGLEEIITGLGMSRQLTEVVRNQLEPSRS